MTVISHFTWENRGMVSEIPIGEMTVEQARVELLDLRGRLDAITALFDPITGAMPSKDYSRAQMLLSALKDRVDAWYKLGTPSGAKDRMNWVENAVFYAAIQDIHCHLKIRRGSPPNAWTSDLDNASFDFGFWLPQLDKDPLITEPSK